MTQPKDFPLNCPQCGSKEIVLFAEPGYDPEGVPTPDWSCEDCGFSGFDTAEEQEAAYANLQADLKAYQDQTGFRKPCDVDVVINPTFTTLRRMKDMEQEQDRVND